MPTLTRCTLLHAIGAALLLTQLAACMTWRPVSGTLDQQVGAEPISRAIVRLRDGAELHLRDVTVRTDSVIGYSEDARERRARSVADVASIDRRRISIARTGGLVGAMYLTGALITVAALASP